MKRGDLVVWRREYDNVGVVLQVNKKYVTVFWIEGIMDYANWEKMYLGVINGKR